MARQHRGPKPKQRFKVYEFICSFKEEHDGLSPTYQEIADNFGWVSVANAYDHVQILEKEGLIILDENRRITIGGEYNAPERKDIPVIPFG